MGGEGGGGEVKTTEEEGKEVNGKEKKIYIYTESEQFKTNKVENTDEEITKQDDAVS